MPPILDVAIGTIFVFLLFSLVVSVLNEVILSTFDQRAKFLHMGLQELLGEAKDKKGREWRKGPLVWLSGGLISSIKTGELTKRLYEHGLINAFSRTDKPTGSSPSYIPAGAFVTALLDIISKDKIAKAIPLSDVKTPNPGKKNLLRRLLDHLVACLESKHGQAPPDTTEELRKVVDSLKAAVEAMPPGMQMQALVSDLKKRLDDATSSQNADALLAIAKELKNVVDPPTDDDHTKENIEAWITKLRGSHDLQESLHSLFIAVDKDVDKFKSALEGWFNACMDRVSGWYKRFAQNWMIVIGFILAASLNVDTVHIVEVLSKSPNLAKAVASQAASYLKDNQRPQTDEGAAKKAQDDVSKAQVALEKAQQGSDQKQIDVAQKRLDTAKEAADPDAKFHAAIAKLSDTGIPMGWNETQLKALDLEDKHLTLDRVLKIWEWWPGAVGTFWPWFSGHITAITSLILGWFLTALAASLGAPFWFDTLSRIMNIRNSGKLPGEKDPTSTPVKPPPATLDQTPRARS